jgi:hypothetical protein
MSVYFVYLRRPRGLDDRRNDPFWEFGSFGKTGCHDKHLLHPQNSRIRDGDQLAFLQGGDAEIRVVGLTPALKVAGTEARIELKWNKAYRPLPFPLAPLLINNQGGSAFPAVYSALKLDETNRSTFCGRAASGLRSRSTEVSHDLAQEIIVWFSAPGLQKITIYPQAIEAESGAWYRHAIHQKWAGVSERSSEYKSVGTTASPRSQPAPESQNPKRRC